MNSSLAKNLTGTWITDHTRTLWELRRTLGANHQKTLAYKTHPFPLLLHYESDTVTYYYRDTVCKVRQRIIAEDEHTVMTEVEPSELNEQKLWHIHFLTPASYWVTVDLDWGLPYPEFSYRMVGDPCDEVRRTYAQC